MKARSFENEKPGDSWGYPQKKKGPHPPEKNLASQDKKGGSGLNLPFADQLPSLQNPYCRLRLP